MISRVFSKTAAYVAQPDDFGPRRAHGAFGLFCLTRIYLPTCLPAYPLRYPPILRWSAVVAGRSHVVRPVLRIAPVPSFRRLVRVSASVLTRVCLAAVCCLVWLAPWPGLRRRARVLTHCLVRVCGTCLASSFRSVTMHLEVRRRPHGRPSVRPPALLFFQAEDGIRDSPE
eukprot:COSAG01_NODE_13259_length_1611_cov_1.240741_1_plen_171_part_00